MFSLKNWKQGASWTNWSGSYQAYPSHFFAPDSIDELIEIVRLHNKQRKTIRVTGAAHSFSPIAVPEYSAVSLHNLRGLMTVDHNKMEATFYAGTYLYEMGPLLAEHGLAVFNMGDIDVQSLAGVVSTGTHGTGISLSSFSNSVVKWGIINGQGQYIEHHRGEDDISEALHISLGLLGIFVTLTIKVRPLYSLHYRSERVEFPEVLNTFSEKIQFHRHAEWYYFPSSELIQLKTMDEVPAKQQSRLAYYIDRTQQHVVENGLFYIASELCALKPTWSHHVSRLSAQFVSTGTKTGLCYEIYPTPRSVKFHETEYAVPLNKFETCLEEIHYYFKKRNKQVHFPIECRTAAGESGFLSPTQGEEVAYFAFHMYAKQNPQQYFQWVDSLMKKYNGRAHWGKLNRYSTQTVEKQYKHLDKFETIRQQFDPSNIFMTVPIRKTFSRNFNS